MTEPTDAEIKDLYTQETGFTLDDSPAALLDFARAILAKWGSPVVAGEVVAWLSTDSIGERYLCFTKPKDTDPARPLVFGDAAPQPTQAQAGAVPLTDEQIGSLACVEGLTNIEVPAIQWLVREVEYLHGIKGGQHG